jgi:hypothetical protein
MSGYLEQEGGAWERDWSEGTRTALLMRCERKTADVGDDNAASQGCSASVAAAFIGERKWLDAPRSPVPNRAHIARRGLRKCGRGRIVDKLRTSTRDAIRRRHEAI